MLRLLQNLRLQSTIGGALRNGPSRLGRSSFSSASAAPLPPHPDYNSGERLLHEKLAVQLNPTKLRVDDISGGCGSMYAVEVESSAFKGLTVVKQHRLVTEILKDDIKGMHGIRIKTAAA